MMSGKGSTRSGCYVHAGVPANDLSSDALEMRGGQLLSRGTDGRSATIDNIDYLVIAMECCSTIVSADFGSVSTLPFHARWTATREKILAGDQPVAGSEFTRLRIEGAASPGVTESDTIGRVTACRAALEKRSG